MSPKLWNGNQVGTKMTNSAQETELLALFATAESFCDWNENVEHHEQAFIHLLEFIQDNPNMKASAEQRFLEALSRRPLYHELIGFCMHTLRFTSVLDKARSLIDPNEPRGWGPLSSIVSSFDDDWGDRDLYEYYRSGAAPDGTSTTPPRPDRGWCGRCVWRLHSGNSRSSAMNKMFHTRARIGIPTPTTQVFLFVDSDTHKWDPWWQRFHEYLLEQAQGITTWKHDPARSISVGEVSLSEMQQRAVAEFLRTAPKHEFVSHKTLRRAASLPIDQTAHIILTLFRSDENVVGAA